MRSNYNEYKIKINIYNVYVDVLRAMRTILWFTFHTVRAPYQLNGSLFWCVHCYFNDLFLSVAHTKWAHWIDFLSLVLLRPQNDHSYYHVAKTIINKNNPINKLHTTPFGFFFSFDTNTPMFCKQHLKLVHWHLVAVSVFVTIGPHWLAFKWNRWHTLSLARNNPLVSLAFALVSMIMSSIIDLLYARTFPAKWNRQNEFRQPVFNIMLLRLSACKSCFKRDSLSLRKFIKFRYQMSSQLLWHIKPLNP